jgi:hypothetical protein
VTSSGGTSPSGGVLAFTGMPAPVGKIIGAGLLGIGLGLILMGPICRRRALVGSPGSVSRW